MKMNKYVLQVLGVAATLLVLHANATLSGSAAAENTAAASEIELQVETAQVPISEAHGSTSEDSQERC